ncbi:MAG: hypothetical protein M8353_06085, partial [ANME-2 cluster archaeon]|nr:hypothetical protein [ANME-2 cluster archaeon]
MTNIDSISGMKGREIDEIFDDILKFTEIEQFLDTPVKRYSAVCMNAQSCASGGRTHVCRIIRGLAHMEPEILLV